MLTNPGLALLLTMAVAMICTYGIAESARGVGQKRVIEPFDYKGVTLDDGSMRRQFDEARDYYLRIPNDDLLKGFRARAGVPAPGVDLGGWYSADIFHIFGQIISGLSRMYAATGDPACKEKVDCLISEWGKCIEPDGFFYFTRKPNAPHYVYEKMVCGLVDAFVYCGNQEALKHLDTITDWAEKNLDRTNEYAFNSGGGPTEWYTLSENLYRAYLATGDRRYKDFARVWEFTDYWNTYASKGDIFQRVGEYHAYSHVNTLSGAGAAYLATGEKHYLDALINAYDYLQQHQVFATGGYGPDERLLPADELRRRLYSSANTFEIQCGSWAAFKMSKYLMSFTGDARYGDWVERLVINGIGASTPMSPDGSIFYYANYNVGGGVKRDNLRWACCAGTRPQAIADYYDLVYFKDSDGIYVNLFAPSSVRWSHNGDAVVLTQKTRFPEGEKVEIIVSAAKPSTFGIKVRVPGWLAGPMTATVNGKPTKVQTNKLNWAVFRRTWKDGDRLSIELPMGFWSAGFPDSSEEQFPAAVLRGPVVLVFRSENENPSRLVDLDKLESALIPSPGESLTYRLAADQSVLARPFYAVKAGERYFMYLDPEVRHTVVPHELLTYSPGWQDVGSMHITTHVGATVEHTFEGTGVRWIGFKYDDAGIAEVSIDGKVEEKVDMYIPARGLPFTWEKRGLQPGEHTIRIKLLQEKNPAASDRFINIARLEVF